MPIAVVNMVLVVTVGVAAAVDAPRGAAIVLAVLWAPAIVLGLSVFMVGRPRFLTPPWTRQEPPTAADL